MVILSREENLQALKDLQKGQQIVFRMTEEQAANLSLCYTAKSALESLVGRYIVNQATENLNKEVVEDVLEKYIAVGSDSYEMTDKVLFYALGEEAYMFLKDPRNKLEYHIETLNKMIVIYKHVCEHCK